MLYEIEQAVFERFPGYARMAVVAEGVDNTREIPELAELLAQCEEGVRRDDLEDFWHVPVLETWAEAFSGMGIKPKKNPPSVINLIKRCRAGKPLPFINPLVAIFNCISLKYLLPCGGDDLNVIEGDLRLGIADGTENYVPLGQPDVLEHPQPGEVIYYDTATKDVFCRAWCWKNGNRSKLMPETTNAVINVDAMPPLPLATAEQAAEEGARVPEPLHHDRAAEARPQRLRVAVRQPAAPLHPRTNTRRAVFQHFHVPCSRLHLGCTLINN